jgi:hypothetical protein
MHVVGPYRPPEPAIWAHLLDFFKKLTDQMLPFFEEKNYSPVTLELDLVLHIWPNIMQSTAMNQFDMCIRLTPIEVAKLKMAT